MAGNPAQVGNPSCNYLDFFLLYIFINCRVELQGLGSFGRFQSDNDMTNCFSVSSMRVLCLDWGEFGYLTFINFFNFLDKLNLINYLRTDLTDLYSDADGASKIFHQYFCLFNLC